MAQFKRFALRYLDDWCSYDRGFVSGISQSSPRADRIKWLSKAFRYYRVARTLPKIDEPERFGKALDAIDAVREPIIEDAVDSTVCDLATAFQSAYGLACPPKTDPVVVGVPMTSGRGQETLHDETQTTHARADHPKAA